MSAAATREPAWLVLPTYNEAENVEAFVGAVQAVVPASAHILIVDDNSPDGTGEIADSLAAKASKCQRHAPAAQGRPRPCLHRRLPPRYGSRRSACPGDGLGFLPRSRPPAGDVGGGRGCDLDSIESKGYAFQVEITYRTIQRGFKVAEVPIVFRDRLEGSSKIDLSIITEAIWRVPMLRLRG